MKPSCSLWLARALSCVPWDELLESVAEMHSPCPTTAVNAWGKLEENVGKFPFILYGSQASFLACVRSFS